MSTRSFLWKVLPGQDLPEYMQPEPEPASFSDSAKGMSDADVRRIVSDLVDNAWLYEKTGYDLDEVPTSIMRDSLYGAQKSSPALFFRTSSRKGQVPTALARRLNVAAFRPGQEYSRTGVDLYRLRNPDEIVAPYAKSYNDEWGM